MIGATTHINASESLNQGKLHRDSRPHSNPAKQTPLTPSRYWKELSQREQTIFKLIVQTRQRDGLKPLEVTQEVLSDEARLELKGWKAEFNAPVGQDAAGAPLPPVPDHLLGQVHRLALSLQGARQYFTPALLSLAWQRCQARLRAPNDGREEARWQQAYQQVEALPAFALARAVQHILASADERLARLENPVRTKHWAEEDRREHVRAILARYFYARLIAQEQT